MLSIGWTEMMLIAAIALIVVGPKDLPAMLQQVGKFAGQIRRMGNDFKSEINKAVAVDELKDLKKSVTNPLSAVKRDIQKEFNSIGADGSVKPSGALKPADPKVEDVTSEIHKAAGMPTPFDKAGADAKDAMTEAMRKAQAEATAAVGKKEEVAATEAEDAPKAKAAAKPKATTSKAAVKKPAVRKAPAKKPATVAARSRRKTVDGAST